MKDRLREALEDFLGRHTHVSLLADVIRRGCEAGRITYSEVEELCGEDAEDVLLVIWEWRLLLPVRFARCGEWDERLLMAQPGEVYELPNVVVFLARSARDTGVWDSQQAVGDLLKVMGEPDWMRVPRLVERLVARSSDRKVNAVEIGGVCTEAGLGDRVDAMIATLKAAGVISPRLGPLVEVGRTGSPIYELNPCLFPTATCSVAKGRPSAVIGSDNRPESDSQGNLVNALRVRFGEVDAGDLGLLLSDACRSRSVSYEEIGMPPASKDDALLLAFEERLVLPVKSLPGSAWEDRMLTLLDEERYCVPHVVRLLVGNAQETGSWDWERAAGLALAESGEGNTRMAMGLLRELRGVDRPGDLKLTTIQAVSSGLGQTWGLHELLDRLVRCGIISPRTQRSLRTGESTYELNPSLCWKSSDEITACPREHSLQV